LEYSIEIFEGELEEKKIEDFLNSRINKRAILKAVSIDLAWETPSKPINESTVSGNKKSKSKFLY
jgi:hypothetical protein